MAKAHITSSKKLTSAKVIAASPKINKSNPFPVVAIGSSAGGLEAASILFKNLPANTGMAFIYVQHLSPDHKSLLTPILSKITGMKVQEIDNMEHMLPNNVYVIPNNRGIKVTNGHIKLIPRSKGGTAISIDVLFSSLALTHKENVVGVILSGNGKDGTEGLEAIKKAGGITFAQDSSAQAPSMPNSAIASGSVDFVLSPKVIAGELTKLGKTGLINHRLKHIFNPVKNSEETIKDNDPALRAILNTLHKEIDVDFSLYKMATVKRRIRHRMMQCKMGTIKEYARLVSGKKKEVELLYKDLLINITNFFRDEDTFNYLKSTFLPELLKSKQKGHALRIWIPACSTGEEAYAIAILISELQANKVNKVPVQIFATDLSDQAISDARMGEYTEDNLKPVGKKRIERYFTKSGKQYRVVKEIRDVCVFATHNLLRDPPFSRIDFISCRNLLIYFDSDAQKKALATMNFALNDGGFLLLGKSETVGIASPLFSTMSNKYKIYQRKNNHEVRRIPELTQRFMEKNTPEKISRHLSERSPPVVFSDLDQAIDSTMLSIYMPPSVVINKNMEIMKFRGDTSLYLSHQSGQASLNILKMTRPEFVFELRNAIQEVIKTNTPVVKNGIELNPNISKSVLQVVTLEVRPLAIEGEALYLVVFRLQEADELVDGRSNKENSRATNIRINKQIEELHKAGAEMITVIEAQDKAYEELQAANEAIISASEEFQTLNEELETSKEEIEATNEELLTTNQELQMRNEQLAESYNFSEAVAETMHEPMIILDKHLRIKSANKAFYQTFHVMERGTKGMLLYELGNHQWDILSLRRLLENINQKNTHFYEHEVTHTFPEIGKKTMLLNARRIVQKTQNDQLILLTFTDTTELIKKRKSDNKGLEDIIKRRTKALDKSYKTVIEKNTYLEKINKELETFTFISSHDLQEPLRKIRMFTSIILEDESKHLSAEGKENLERIQTTGNRMQQLIDDLLLYAAVKDGEKILKRISLNEIVAEVIDEFKEALIQNHGTIESEGICSANIIGFQFRQLIHNLISNAIKFAHPKRFPRITIKSQTTSGKLLNYDNLLPEVNYCHICFSDNGIGFDPQYKDRIFEVFQRLHGQETYKGTGIGLAICKRIVENHKGIIVATGKPDKGAQFDIYIPAF
jgi:two-component system CheB/CheR fusion protein